MNGNKNVIYFDSFRVEHISKEIKKFVENKNNVINIYTNTSLQFDHGRILLYWIY